MKYGARIFWSEACVENDISNDWQSKLISNAVPSGGQIDAGSESGGAREQTESAVEIRVFDESSLFVGESTVMVRHSERYRLLQNGTEMAITFFGQSRQ